jgi:sugar lactone lactonase YvrE
MKKLKNTLLLAATAIFVIGGLIGTNTVSTQNSVSQKQNQPLITLETSENETLDVPFATALAVASSKDAKRIFTLRRDTQSVSVADNSLKIKKNVSTFLPVAKAFAVDSKERVYAVSNTELTVTDAEGNQVTKYPIPATTTSLAAFDDGSVAVAAADYGRLITIFDKSGKLVRKVGGFKQFNESNAAQNRFLNSGKVAISQSGEIYYVSMYSPTPTVQKFSKQGNLLKEFTIEGAALELQSKRANEFLRERKPDCTGGYQIIKTLAVDPTTGHLWVGVNGSSRGNSVIPESGVLYEYNSEGEKLAEYALVITATSAKATKIITDIQEIAVSFPNVYVLTSASQVYRFDLNKRLAANPNRQ